MSLQSTFEKATPWIERAIANKFALGAASAFLVALPIVLVVWGIPLAGRVATRLMPQAVNEWISSEIDVIVRGQTFSSRLNEAKRADIQARFDQLKRSAGVPNASLHFRSGFTNAFAGGERVVLMDELVEVMENNDLVAAVLAHELAHLKHDHSAKRLFTSAALYRMIIPFLSGESANAKIAGALGHLFLESSFSRDHESEADVEALSLLEAIGQRPATFARAMERLQSASRVMVRKSSYTLTHPPTAERIARALEADRAWAARTGLPNPAP